MVGGGGGGGCSCMLLLHPVPTSADAGPDFCTLCPDLCTWCLWCPPSTCASIPFAQVVVVTSCKLPWWCFFIQSLVLFLTEYYATRWLEGGAATYALI